MPSKVKNTSLREGHMIDDPDRPGKPAYVCSGPTLNPDGLLVVSITRSSGVKPLVLGPPGTLVTVYNRKDITRGDW